jgi:hypothetical protein
MPGLARPRQAAPSLTVPRLAAPRLAAPRLDGLNVDHRLGFDHDLGHQRLRSNRAPMT